MAKSEGHETEMPQFQMGERKYAMDFSAVVLYRAIPKLNLLAQCSLQQPQPMLIIISKPLKKN
jgi:hypothetical protein